MAGDTLQDKASELLGQLGPSQLAAVVHLLEVMARGDDDEHLTEEDCRAIAASRDYFQRGGEGISFEEAVAECGFTMEEVLSHGTDRKL